MYCLVVYDDMNGKGRWVVRVRLSGGTGGDVSGQQSSFVKKARDCVSVCACYHARVLLTKIISVDRLWGLRKLSCCFYVDCQCT